jgi:uncharacterized protein
MLKRSAISRLTALSVWYPVVAVTGPRQSGKTTLVREVFASKPYATLEDPDVRATALADPRGFLGLYPDGAILDEVQRAPDLFSYLQGLVDEQQVMGQWILTGSQQLGLMSGVSQTLAGRVGLLQLLPFSVGELLAGNALPASRSLEDMLWRGLYPAPTLRKVPPSEWYADYFATYVERDVRQMLQVRDLTAFRLFVRMCAARTGQLLNLSALAADCGISTNTAKGWLSVLEASYIVFTLKPHHANFGKQLTKSPKLYFHDTGLATWLAGLRSADALSLSSMRGALFENWAVCEALKHSYNQRLDLQMHFWRNKSGIEVDLLIEFEQRLQAVEFKAGKTVASDWFGSLKRYAELMMKNGGSDLIQTLVYGGEATHTRPNVQVMGWRAWAEELAKRYASDTTDPHSF